MTTHKIMRTFVICLVFSGSTFAQQRKVYKPTWESLDQHPTPGWFRNAKLGLFIYGPGCTKEEWERYNARYGGRRGVARHLGAKYTKHYAETAWDKVPWDPDGLARLAGDAGARYVVFARNSLILNHPSKHNDVDGSMFMRMGPKGRDYVAEIATAVRARKLRFGLYTNYINPRLVSNWPDTVREAIDRYQPSTLWFDGDKLRYSATELKSRELAAYYYNHSKNQADVAIEDAMGSYKSATWGRRLAHGDWYRKEESPPHDNISDGYYVRYRELFFGLNSSPVEKPQGLANNLVEWLADCSAKNGNLELAIFLGPPAVFALEKRALRQLGIWLEVNREAIYDTRPWHEGKPQSQTRRGIHVRYTTKGDSLYAILFEYPRQKPSFPNLRAAQGTKVRMLGIQASSIPWRQTGEGLVVDLPPQDIVKGKRPDVPCDHAFVYKITPVPSWLPTQPGQPAASPIKKSKVGQNVLAFQYGKNGYHGQTNEKLTTGQWADELGFDSHGADDLFLFDNKDVPRYARALIRFDLEGQLPKGAKVTRAVLALYSPWGVGGTNVMEGYEAVKPWTDGKTWWQNWGRGGTEPGFIAGTAVLRGKVSSRGSHHFFLDTSVVQTWIEHPKTNHGLLLKTIRGDNNFHWKADGDKGKFPPKLIVEFNVE